MELNALTAISPSMGDTEASCYRFAMSLVNTV